MKALILSTIGTPGDPSLGSVKQFVSNYLGDKYVISAPSFLRKRIIEKHIIPHHIEGSVIRYQRLWEMYNCQMPLTYYMDVLQERMQEEYPDYSIFTSRLYTSKELSDKLVSSLREKGSFTEVILLPLYPQKTYSSYISTVVNTKKLVMEALGKRTPIKVIPPYYNHPAYISIQQQRILQMLEGRDPYDLHLFSFHSIPTLHQWAGQLQGFHYRKQCSITAQLINAGLPHSVPYRVSFQSAMGTKWLHPFTEDLLKTLPKQGFKRILVICPGFLTDCLETVHDIDTVEQSSFLKAGGEELSLVPALNGESDAGKLFMQLVKEHCD